MASLGDRTIWMYWVDQPGRPAPPYIARCLASVEANSGCTVRLCGAAEARELLPDLPHAFSRLKPAHQSDLFRTGVLARNGGMYLDADTFVLRSLTPLFDLLGTYEYVGMDWRPRNKPRGRWAPLGIGIMGPCRPGLKFLACAYAAQLKKVRRASKTV